MIATMSLTVHSICGMSVVPCDTVGESSWLQLTQHLRMLCRLEMATGQLQPGLCSRAPAVQSRLSVSRLCHSRSFSPALHIRCSSSRCGLLTRCQYSPTTCRVDSLLERFASSQDQDRLFLVHKKLLTHIERCAESTQVENPGMGSIGCYWNLVMFSVLWSGKATMFHRTAC